jgi:acetylglutamate kinase
VDILHYIPQSGKDLHLVDATRDKRHADARRPLLCRIRIVMVHGAAAQIRLLAEQQGIKASDLDGTGVTDAATLNLALAAANRLTHEILEGLSANDLRAASPNVIIAHPAGIIQGVDQLFTGKVERVDAELLQLLLAQGVVPAIPPLGFDGDGKTYRVNSDGVALAVAEQLKAIKLIFVTSQDGLIHRGQLIRQMLVADRSCSSWIPAASDPRCSRRRSMPSPRATPACHGFTSSTARSMKGSWARSSPPTASAP